MKRPKHEINLPQASRKETRQEPIKVATMRPSWVFRRADRAGDWPWGAFEDQTAILLFTRLAEFEQQTWAELQQTEQHHPMDLSELGPEAQQRIRDLKREDIDGLFSFRITKKSRIWGEVVDGVYHVLWWDPNHTVYTAKGAQNSRATKRK